MLTTMPAELYPLLLCSNTSEYAVVKHSPVGQRHPGRGILFLQFASCHPNCYRTQLLAPSQTPLATHCMTL